MDVIRHCLSAAVAGAVAGVTALLGVLTSNVAGLCTIILHDPGGWLALGLLMIAFAGTFGCGALGGALTTEPTPEH